jgi:hypothetical protein
MNLHRYAILHKQLLGGRYTYTTQAELRAAFWEQNPDCTRRPGSQNAQTTDTRCAFCYWLNTLACNGEISPDLADRATL